MASRPFASVAVALEAGGDQEELLQVSKKTHTRTHTHGCKLKRKHTLTHTKRETKVLF